MVSGGVYTAYDVLVIKLIPQNDGEEYLSSSTWPNSWHDSNIGKAGLVLCGLAFLAATVVQLEQFVTKSFHNTLRKASTSTWLSKPYPNPDHNQREPQ